MNTIIEQIKAEIERLKKEHQEPTFPGDEYEEGGINGYQIALDKVLAKLDTLKVQPVCEDLEEEIERYQEEHFEYNSEFDSIRLKGDYMPSPQTLANIARHFYELGRSEKPNNHLEQPVCEGLEDEIDRYCESIQAWQVQEAPFTSLGDCARHFAQWQKEQMLK